MANVRIHVDLAGDTGDRTTDACAHRPLARGPLNRRRRKAVAAREGYVHDRELAAAMYIAQWTRDEYWHGLVMC